MLHALYYIYLVHNITIHLYTRPLLLREDGDIYSMHACLLEPPFSPLSSHKSTLGDHSGSIPGTAERLHHSVSGADKTRRSPARCEAFGGGHVSSTAGALCAGQGEPVQELH